MAHGQHRTSSDTRDRGLFGVSVVALLISLIALVVTTVLFVQRTDLMLVSVRSQATLTAQLPRLRQALSDLLDAETGQRGYLLTHRVAYLEPYRVAVSNLPALMSQLEQVPMPDDGTRLRIGRIEALTRLKLAELAETIRLHDLGRRDEAMQLVLNDTGRNYMDEARDLIEQSMGSLEGERDQLGKDIAAGAARSTRLMIAAVSLLVILLVVMSVQVIGSFRAYRLLVGKLDDEATHDKLTGLANRRFHEEWLASCVMVAARGGRPVSLFALDLDGFKGVNDEGGHEAGDQMLRDVSQAFRDALRASDFLCRMGGDEFSVIALEEADRESLLRLSSRLIECVAITVRTSTGARGKVGLSIGIACYPADGVTPGALVSAADTALYAAKKQGKGRACFYGDGR